MSLKVESLEMMAVATEPYANHRERVEALTSDLEAAYKFAKLDRDTEISTHQWQILLDPNRHLLGGFFKHWEESSTPLHAG